MGGASSREQQASVGVTEEEKEAASMGTLPMLQKAFSKLSDPHTKAPIPLNSLKECFCLNTTNLVTEASSSTPECFLKLLAQLGLSLVDLFFIADKGGIQWVEFLRGFIRCCGRMPLSMALNNLFRLYSVCAIKAGIPSKLDFESDSVDSKIGGYLLPSELRMLLWMCWIMSQSSRIMKFSEGKFVLVLPDVNHLILSATISCSENSKDLNVKECDISALKNHISAQKLHIWALTTTPGLADCFTQYVHSQLQICASSKDDSDGLIVSLGDTTSDDACNTFLLTCGRAWAISLTQRNNAFSEELLRVCTPGQGIGTSEYLLYRSSEHGRGLNRFWAGVEGYHGPLLLLISANSSVANDDNTDVGRWVIAVLTHQGFENRDLFYGSSGYLYAISPVFHLFPPSGKDKNFIYSHLHPTGRVYDAHPKPVGIGFGGTVGQERIFMDEDFARITVRHHSTDKTYQPGSLFPNQGYLPVEASVLEVEVWGLGGKTAKEKQDMYKKRESLFSEQRRKVDLKNFASWEDSPEKLMMDMVADPNRVQREDR